MIRIFIMMYIRRDLFLIFFLFKRKVITIIFPQTSLDLMTWDETFFFFCHDLQVVVRQSIGEIYKCKSVTDPHYRLLNLESRYTLSEILPVHNRSRCIQGRNSLTKFCVKVSSCNRMLTSVKLHLKQVQIYGNKSRQRSTFAGNSALLPSEVIDLHRFWRETVPLLDVN